MRIHAAIGACALLTLGAVSTAKANVGYGWAGTHLLTGSYNTLAQYSYNSSGGNVHVDSFGTGVYRVTFSGLAVGHLSLGVAQVVAYEATPNYCNLSNYSLAGVNFADVVVDVLCYDAGGRSANTRFFVAYERETNFYVNTISGSSPSSDPFTSHADNGVTPLVSRSSTGVYTVGFDNDFTFPPTGAEGGNAIATAIQSNNHCQVYGWDGPDGTFYVFCYAPSGAPADTAFTLSAGVHGATKSNGIHYGYAYNPTSTSYNNLGFPSYEEDVNGFQRWGTGSYALFHSAPFPTSGIVLVNALIQSPIFCKPSAITNTGSFPPTRVNTVCYWFNGSPVNTYYVEQFVTNP